MYHAVKLWLLDAIFDRLTQSATIRSGINVFDSHPTDKALSFINKVDANGLTALHIALKNENVKTALILLNAGACCDIQ